MYKNSHDIPDDRNESSILPTILIGYEPGVGYLRFLANDISNITTTNGLSQIVYFADCSNFAPNKYVIEC